MYLSPQEGSTSALGLGMPALSMGDNLGDEGTGEVPDMLPFTASPWSAQGDGVALTTPAYPGSGNANGASSANAGTSAGMFAPLFGALGSLFSQMSQMFPTLNGSQNASPVLGNCTQQPRRNGATQAGGNEQLFQNATASSTGDPHLAFNGANAAGANVSDRWNNMNSHTDLLDSNSFAGGYRISTQATQPNQNGVTYNQEATVSTGGGNVAVSLDASGNATFSRNGTATAIQNGQTYKLGRGESVTRNNDGSLIVTDRNAQGGSIATTLSDNGNGVDVNVQAANVNLGGYMTAVANGQP